MKRRLSPVAIPARYPALIVAIMGLSLVLSGCQVAGIGAPDATSTPLPPPTATPARPTATAATTGGSSGAAAKQWSSPPPTTIDPTKTYRILMHTTLGDFVITLLPREAPLAANNFLFLVRQHFYDNVTFHRIYAGFVIQGGDPQGTGVGGPGYGFATEPPKHENYTKGIVAMAHSSQPDSNGSQFFIVLGDLRASLPKDYSIFGKVTAGMATIDKIAAVPTTDNGQGEKSRPLQQVRIIRASVQ